MSAYLDELIIFFKEFSGIGQRGAERIVNSLLQWPPEKIAAFGEKLKNLPSSIKKCDICGNITEFDTCEICTSVHRDSAVICVVEDFSHISSIEKSGFKGLYHILGGKLSPLNDVNPEDLNIQSLLNRLENNNRIQEIIMALSQDVEGQATAYYLTDQLNKYDIKITSLARGIPAGADLSFANSATISVALTGRVSLK